MSISSLFAQLKSDVPDFEWPKVLTGQTASLFSTLFELSQSEYLSPEDLLRLQDAQLDRLLRHAATEVPFYADRLRQAGVQAGKTPVPMVWSKIPILTRSDIQTAGKSLHAKSFPESHGTARERSTSGSTSRPVRFMSTDFTDFQWRCANMRDRMWHGVDLGGTLVLITGGAGQMAGQPFVEVGSWSLSASSLRKPGRQFKLNPTLTVDQQVSLIGEINPTYIQTRPSQLNLLLRGCEKSGERFSRLRAVFCVSEIVTAPLREACLATLGVPIHECYSCAEAGYLALQCPEDGKLHVQSEMVRVEILNADDEPCEPGETGRVILTSLHNYAMPLIRYEIGDEAEAGLPCACGRGLPVIARVIGRTQDYVKLRSGQSIRANLYHGQIAKIAAIVEFQIAQRALGRLEIRLVARRPLDEDETTRLKTLLSRQGNDLFEVDVTYCQAIERAASGKLRTFVCEVE